MSLRTVEFGEAPVSVVDIADIGLGRARAALSAGEEYRARLRSGPELLDRLLASDGVVYGVTTGYGDSCGRRVPAELVAELPLSLTRYHGCGTGRYLPVETARAVMAARLASLSRGYSGVTPELLELLVCFLDRGISPLIPEEGSVGASGDLTPLSYLAAALVGERHVDFRGETWHSADAIASAGLSPYRLRPKEALALMNGTAVMTGIACLAFTRAEYLGRLASRITSLSALALHSNAAHFRSEIFELKPFEGQQQCAEWIRRDVSASAAPSAAPRLQDRYSIRCAPHVIGVLLDALPMFRRWIEIELNSVNDNPIVDPERELVLHGGHFYGGHVAFVMDSMKNAVANISDLLDRQMALLVDPKFNQGLPENLSGARGDRLMINHGFKAVQIATSAWAAEALKLTMPASVFSRSTECHNQDKVSMGTIAARDCIRVLELTEQVAAATLLAALQGIELRIRAGELDDAGLQPRIRSMREQIHTVFELVDEDRPLDADLRNVSSLIRDRAWPLYD